MQSLTITAPAPSVRSANLSADGSVLVVEFDLNVESDAECRDIIDWPWVDSRQSEFFSDLIIFYPLFAFLLRGMSSGLFYLPLPFISFDSSSLPFTFLISRDWLLF